jgi:hypothetical protein
MPRRGLDTAACKKLNWKFWPEKQTVKRRKPQAVMVCHLPPQGVVPWAAGRRCAAKLTEMHLNLPKLEIVLSIVKENQIFCR